MKDFVTLHAGRHFAMAALLMLPLTLPAQVNNPAYADYFLVGRFGEICTMCEAVILCEADSDTRPYDSIPTDGDFTLYHLQTRTFWSQVSTIWEWFITNFDSESLASSGHSRPFIVYTINDGQWSKPRTVDAHVSLDPAVITIGEQSIDRVERRWFDGSGEAPAGYCQRMPLWESLDIIALHPSGGAES
jgi:hypothetical protein